MGWVSQPPPVFSYGDGSGFPIVVQIENRVTEEQFLRLFQMAWGILGTPTTGAKFYWTTVRTNWSGRRYGIVRFKPWLIHGPDGQTEGTPFLYPGVESGEKLVLCRWYDPDAPGVSSEDILLLNARTMCHECCHAVGLPHRQSPNNLMLPFSGGAFTWLENDQKGQIADGFTQALRMTF